MQDLDSFAIEWWPIGKPRPYPDNPRIIPASAVEKVAAALKAFRWRQPIVVDTEDVIIVGHVRLLAAKRLKLACVPVHVASGLTPDQVRAYRLADNRTHDEAKWDADLLRTELQALSGVGFDLGSAGFDPIELPGEPPAFAPIAEGDVRRLDRRAAVRCPSCGHEFEP